jgi:hypothetical protein
MVSHPFFRVTTTVAAPNRKNLSMTNVSARIDVVAVLIVHGNGHKVITAVHNVPETELATAVQTIRTLGNETGFNIGAYATSNGDIVVENFGIQLDLGPDLAALIETIQTINVEVPQ